MNGYNFTDRTRRALHVAGDEAATFKHEYISTEHILLALLRDRASGAVALLTTLRSDMHGIRRKIEETVKIGSATTPAGAPRPYTSRAKKVLDLAMVAAREDGHSSVETQHLLLGLVREEKGIAAQVLAHAGITPGRVTAALGDARGTDDGTPGDQARRT